MQPPLRAPWGREVLPLPPLSSMTHMTHMTLLDNYACCVCGPTLARRVNTGAAVLWRDLTNAVKPPLLLLAKYNTVLYVRYWQVAEIVKVGHPMLLLSNRTENKNLDCLIGCGLQHVL
jgi:hypothetical protein